VRNNQIRTIIEYGCGDGNQLILSQYQSYIGFDISQEAILHCELQFAADNFDEELYYRKLNDFYEKSYP